MGRIINAEGPGWRITDVPEPEWLHQSPDKWPASAKNFWRIMGEEAERRLAEQQQGESAD